MKEIERNKEGLQEIQGKLRYEMPTMVTETQTRVSENPARNNNGGDYDGWVREIYARSQDGSLWVTTEYHTSAGLPHCTFCDSFLREGEACQCGGEPHWLKCEGLPEDLTQKEISEGYALRDVTGGQ